MNIISLFFQMRKWRYNSVYIMPSVLTDGIVTQKESHFKRLTNQRKHHKRR